MAITLTNAAVTPSTTARTLVYDATAVINSATIINGTITNIDDVNKSVHFVTVEMEVQTGVFKKILNNSAVPYGISPTFPKINLKPGQKLHVTVSSANVVDVVVQLAER